MKTKLEMIRESERRYVQGRPVIQGERPERPDRHCQPLNDGDWPAVGSVEYVLAKCRAQKGGVA